MRWALEYRAWESCHSSSKAPLLFDPLSSFSWLPHWFSLQKSSAGLPEISQKDYFTQDARAALYSVKKLKWRSSTCHLTLMRASPLSNHLSPKWPFWTYRGYLGKGCQEGLLMVIKVILHFTASHLHGDQAWINPTGVLKSWCQELLEVEKDVLCFLIDFWSH